MFVVDDNDSYIRDDRSFKSYRVVRENLDWREDELPALAEKKEKSILMAVVRNNVNNLRKLLTSPKWYRIADRNGLNLLHIAILEKSRNAFDYLLTLPNFPLEMISDYGESALITSILVINVDQHGNMKHGDDYFAWKLIEAGADIFYIDHFDYTTISCAALKHHVKMADHFIQNGVDVHRQDVYGNTALHHAVDHDGPDCLEFVGLLLDNGADPAMLNKDDVVAFEKAVSHCQDSLLQEVLFYYTYDEYTEMKTHFSVLARLARYHSPLLTYFEDASIDCSYIKLFDVDVEYLEILLKKFKFAIASILPKCILREWSPNDVTFEKLELFINSDLKKIIIFCIQNEEDDLLFRHLIECDLDESTACNITCYLLSYGLGLTKSGLQRIYQKFGYCNFFKILLHMDIQIHRDDKRDIMPGLLYDTSLDLEYYFKNYDNFCSENVHHLLCYFVNSQLNEICYSLYGEEIRFRIRNLPQVPLLLELARNTFRKYFIQRFQIKTSRKFYTLINDLNVSNVYKKIITFEKKLY